MPNMPMNAVLCLAMANEFLGIAASVGTMMKISAAFFTSDISVMLTETG